MNAKAFIKSWFGQKCILIHYPFYFSNALYSVAYHVELTVVGVNLVKGVKVCDLLSQIPLQ